MNTTTHTPDEQQIISHEGRWYLPVAWDAADNVRSYLKRHGLNSTVCLDPESHLARLELWPGVSPDAVAAALQAGTVVETTVPPLTAA